MTAFHGLFNPKLNLIDQGITGFRNAYFNLTEPDLITHSLMRKEGELGIGGTLLVETGKFTGRSPKDKHIVVTDTTESTVWWDRNARMSADSFDKLHQDMLNYVAGKDLYVQDLFGGADVKNRIGVRIISELCWHNLFIRHLLIRPKESQIKEFDCDFSIINLPGFFANPEKHGCRSETVIAINFDKKLILIGGTEYAGENKKAVFTLLNYILPEVGIMPMHCSANISKKDPNNSAIFFGLSGTGKTTLSSDPDRILIGDDEHGWSDDGIFNFEGGCYAKTINLSPLSEPDIYRTTSLFSTVIENMVYDKRTKELDFEDDSLTANMRAAYPMHYIPNSSQTGLAATPKHVVLLTCDAFGVMPPLAKLTPSQAMYHFLSGFTSKAPGTERGVTEPEPTFSTCFGAPFLPRPPQVYGNLFKKKISENNSTCWLVNTGWTGGGHGVGSRMPINVTRSLLTAAINGDLNDVSFVKDVNFGFEVPKFVPGVDPKYLDPKNTWEDKEAYDLAAKKLISLFMENFEQYLPDVDSDVKDALVL
jgi:phosphoenolpyruvate carboxykinase (ATP)